MDLLLVDAQLEQHLLERLARQRNPNPLSTLGAMLSTLTVLLLIIVIVIVIVNAFHLVRSGVGTSDYAVVFELGQEPVDLIRMSGNQGVGRFFFEPASRARGMINQGAVVRQADRKSLEESEKERGKLTKRARWR